MKSVRKYVSLAVAALMLATVPAVNAFADENIIGEASAVEIASNSDVTITQDEVTASSMKISWNDEGYENNDYMVVAYATKSISPQYGGADTKVVNVSNTNTVELTNLYAEMPYKIFVYRQGTLIAQGEFTTANQVITISQDDVTSNSMTLSWNDQWYRKYEYQVEAYATRSTSPQYGAADTHLETVEAVNSITLTNLVSNMPYYVMVYRQDTVNKTRELIASGTFSTLEEYKKSSIPEKKLRV